jgi:hypothetical protein
MCAELTSLCTFIPVQVVADNVLDLMRFVPQHMPWTGRRQQSLQAIVSEGGPLLGPSGTNDTVTLFDNTAAAGGGGGGGESNRTIGLFFGAQWSQPCLKFLPLLRAAYEAAQGKEFNSTRPKTELVFVSLDQSEFEFDQYRKEIPFPALPFKDRRRALLQIGMNIRSVPSLGNIQAAFSFPHNAITYYYEANCIMLFYVFSLFVQWLGDLFFWRHGCFE